jgi:hypothetical protein
MASPQPSDPGDAFKTGRVGAHRLCRPPPRAVSHPSCPRSRGQEEPRDFCSGEEPSYDLRPYSAMMLPRKL